MNKTKKLIQINQRVMLLVGMTLALFALVLMPVKAHAAALAADEPLPVMASSSSATQASSTTSDYVVAQPMTESPVVEEPPVVRTETDTEVDQPEQSAVATADSVVEDDNQPASPSTYNPGKDITDSVKVHQQLYDDHNQAIDETYSYEIYDQQRLKVNSHFELSDDLADQIQAGDHFEVTLPENLVMSDTTSHNLIASDTDVASSTQPKWVVGTYQLTLGDGPKLLTVTFNDFLANHRAVKNLVGDIDIHGLAKLGELEVTSKTGGVTDINVKPRPSSDVTAEPYRPSKELITKQGFQVPDYDGGPTTDVNWVLDINTNGLVEALETGTTSHTMTNTMIYDNLTLGQTVSERSTPRVTVPVYYRDATGKVLAISGTRLEVRIENEVTVAQVAAANHESETAVTFSQFDNYVKQHLGAYGYFKQTSDGRLFDQNYQAGQITFVMNLGDLGAPTVTGHQLHLTAQTEENAEAQIQRELPTGNPDLTQTLAGYRHLLTATAGTGIAGLHVEFLMHETADVDQTLANTAILTHDRQSTSSNKCAILYDSTESHVALTLAKGVIRIQKSAVALDETGNYPALAGVVFNITDAAGQIVARLVTNANGIAETAELPSGDYLISEMRSVAGYEPVMLADVSGTRLGDGHAYSVTIDRGSDEHGLLVNIFNQKTPTTTITVTKRWRDVPTGVVTPNVEAVLLVNGDPTPQSVTLTPLNHYVGQFNGLALTDAAGKVIRYSVREIPVEGYTAENEGLAPVVNGQAILVNDYLVPDQPKDPKTPNVPDEPKTPIVPETPVTPTTPETPVTPTTPETPVTPTTPETPVTPTTPETPVTPTTPETPTIPETPNTPEEPATPETPDSPSPSTVPETPTASANENEQLPALAVKKANTQTMMTVSTPATAKAKAVSTTTTSATRLPQTNDRGRSSMISLLGLLLLMTICLVADPLTRRQ